MATKKPLCLYNGIPTTLQSSDVVEGSIPKGGSEGQILSKSSLNDYDVAWIDPQFSSGTVSSVNQILPINGNVTLVADDLSDTTSTNKFFTADERSKLSGIEIEANKYVHPSYHSADILQDGTTNKVFSNSDKTKLDGIESGAQVNVQPDWNNLLNKPTIPTALNQLSTDTSNQRVSTSEKTTWNGKQDSLGFTPVSNTTKVNNHTLSGDITLSPVDLAVTQLNNPTFIKDISNFYSYSWSSGIVSGGGLTDNNNGTVNIASGEALLRIADSENADLVSLVFPQVTNLSLTDGNTNWVFVSYNNGSPIIQSSTSFSSFNCLTKCLLYVITRDGNNIYSISSSSQHIDANRKYRRKEIELHVLDHVPGGTVISTSGLNILVTSGEFYLALNKTSHNAINTSLTGATLDRVLRTNYSNGSGGWIKTSGVKVFDNTHYDDGSGTLATLSDNYFGIHWLFLILGSNQSSLELVYGTGNYSTIQNAQAASFLSELPPIISTSNCVLLGRIIFQKNASTSSLIESSFETNFSPAGAVSAAAGENTQVQFNYNGTFGTDHYFTWDYTNHALKLGNVTLLPDNPLAMAGSASAYLQTNLKNIASTGSADHVITADTGNDSQKYADFGIGNSNYTSSSWDSVGPYDTYLLGDGGNVSIASLSVGKAIKFFVAQTEHESHTNDLVGNLDHTGFNIPSGNYFMINGQALNPDHLNDSATTNKFTSSAEKSKLAGIEVGAVKDHTHLDNIGSNTHSQIDDAISNSVSHISASAPHSGHVVSNSNITPGTNTKIQYDAKGLVIGGSSATTADIADSTDKRYVTDAEKAVIGATANPGYPFFVQDTQPSTTPCIII